MQRIQRENTAPPRSLGHGQTARDRRAKFEFLCLDPMQRAQTPPPAGDAVLRDREVLAALTRMSRGRCAFCEACDPSLRTWRFRPATDAMPADAGGQLHLYYAWLAEAWQNLYPICEGCIPEHPGRFPVKGRRTPVPAPEHLRDHAAETIGIWRGPAPLEHPLLLDPCHSSDFHRALRPRFDGRIDGIGDRGAPSVAHFRLNRPARVQQRAHSYATRFEQLVATVSGSGTDGLEALLDFQDMEFGGTWYLLLRRIVARLVEGTLPRPILSPTKIGAVLAMFYGQRGIQKRLREACEALIAEDAASSSSGAAAPVAGPPSSVSRLARIDIRNFRSIDTLRLCLPACIDRHTADAPAPSLLILGENAAGKSSLLEAIALALCGSAAHQRLALSWKAFILDTGLTEGGGMAAPSHAEVIVTLASGGRRHVRLRESGIVMRDHGDVQCPPVFAYGAFRHYQKGRRLFAAHRHVRNLFDGSVLGNPHEWLLELSLPAFDMVVQALRAILCMDGPFEVIERDLQARTCHVVTRIEDASGRPRQLRTPLSAVSSGFRTLLALACDVMQGLMDPRINPAFQTLRGSRAVVLVDEIETHLHPRWKMRVMASLREALPQVTFIATTHDPLCLRGMRKGEVMVLHRWYEEGDTSPLRIGLLGDLPDGALMRVDQLLTSDFFRLYSTDDPATTAGLSRVAGLLARERDGDVLSPADTQLLERFRNEICTALPVGDSEIQRLVQEAVAHYLQEREAAAPSARQQLRSHTRALIRQAMERR